MGNQKVAQQRKQLVPRLRKKSAPCRSGDLMNTQPALWKHTHNGPIGCKCPFRVVRVKALSSEQVG